MNSSAATTRPASQARRLLLPAHSPPPPIPPALLSRFLQPRKCPPPKPAVPKWIDGDEFALARSSTSRITPSRENDPHHLRAAGPPVILPFHEPPPPASKSYDAHRPHTPLPLPLQECHGRNSVNRHVEATSYTPSAQTSRSNHKGVDRNSDLHGHMPYSSDERTPRAART